MDGGVRHPGRAPGGWRYPALFALVWFTRECHQRQRPRLCLGGADPVVALRGVRRRRSTRCARRGRRCGGSWSSPRGCRCGGRTPWPSSPATASTCSGTTEKVSAVAKTALSSEVLRGLGYWFFYGSDIAGPWAATSTGSPSNSGSSASPSPCRSLALGAAVVVRWRHRAFFILLIVVGMVLAVGSNPYAAPSTVGGFIKTAMTKTTAGLALRSTNRATPMVLLGLAMLLGAAITALARRSRLAGSGAVVLALALVAAANPPVWNGTTVLDRYTFPTPVPSLRDAGGQGPQCPAHRHAGLRHPGRERRGLPLRQHHRPHLARAPHPPLHHARAARARFAPQLRHDLRGRRPHAEPHRRSRRPRAHGATHERGDVLVQNDLAYELYDRPPPQLFWQSLHLPLFGLSAPVGYGAPAPNVSPIPVVDERPRWRRHPTCRGRRPSRSSGSRIRGPSSGRSRRPARSWWRATRWAQRRGGTRPARHDVAGALLGNPRQRPARSRERARRAAPRWSSPTATESSRFCGTPCPTTPGSPWQRRTPSPMSPSTSSPTRPATPSPRRSTVGVSSVTGIPDDPDHSADMAIDGLSRHGVADPLGVVAPGQVLAGDAGQPGDDRSGHRSPGRSR